MIRRRIAILFLPACLLLLMAALFAWLMHTESGARWIWRQAVTAVPGQLRAGELSGDLQSGLRIVNLAYRDDSLSATADTVTLRLDLDFWPLAVAVHELRFGQLNLRQTSSTAGEAEPAASSPEAWIPRLALPLPIQFDRVIGGRVTWIAADAVEPALDIRQLSFSAWWHRRLELHRLELEVAASSLQGDLGLGLEAPFEVSAELSASLAMAAAGSRQTPLELRARGSGNLEELRLDLESKEPGVAVSGKVTDLLKAPRWDLQLTAAHLTWPLIADSPKLQLDDVVASSYGSVDDYGVEFQGRFVFTGLGPLTAHILGSGTHSGLALDLLDVAGDDLALKGEGRFDWQGGPRAEAAINVERFEPTRWIPQWADAQPLTGRVNLSWEGERIDFTVLDLQAQGTVAALRGTGSVDLADGTIDAKLGWEDLLWPPGSAEPRVLSRGGNVVAGGRLDSWTANGDLELSGPDFPAGRLQVKGTGDSESLHFAIPRGEVLDGELAGDFDLRWLPELRWSAKARVGNIATAPLLASFPGRLSGDLAVQGSAEPSQLDIDLRNVGGVIRDRRVTAGGRLTLRDGVLSAQALQITSGDSSVTLDGNPEQGAGLAFTARIASLGDLADGAAGSLEGAGTVRLSPDRLGLKLSLQGEDLAWDGGRIGSLEVRSGASEAAPILITLQDMALGDQAFEALTLETDGATPLERIDAKLVFDGGRAALRMTGRVNDWSAPVSRGWNGRLEQFRVESDAVGFIELEEAAALSARDLRFSLATACFRGSKEGRLCAESNWQLDGERNIEASLEGVSPNLALTLVGSSLQFTQKFSGSLSWRQQPGASAVAAVNLDISPGEITNTDDDETIIATGAGRFGFQVADGRLYSGKLNIPLSGGGIDTDFSVPDLSNGLASAAQGHIRIDLDNDEPLLKLVPGLEGSSGPVTADLNFSGTLSDPQLTGHLSLVRGRLSHFASGLQIEDLQLAGAVYQYDQTELRGTFRAGEGSGSIRTVLNFSNLLEPELLLELKGDNLTVINVPDLSVTANPDVRLVWRRNELSLGGRVLVPAARLSPRYLQTSAAMESPDVVIVAGQDPLAAAQEARPTEWRLRGSLELELGDNVQVMIERAKAQLKGKTRFTWEGQAVPVADGSFSVTGEINAYGQLLKVTDGRINFSNRPADNPFLNIRAEREIYGNSQVRRAGVLVTGTLRQPVLEPYSVPMTTRERALTLLVTGSDFNYEQGVGTVEVGMYVAPKLYISYGIGLFDEQNVISARYDLGKGFGIKTTSGQRETGADISYTIEH